MKFEKTKTFNIEGALRGLRNPKDSWHLSDSMTLPTDDPDYTKYGGFKIGPKDMKLAKSLIRGGPEHRKFLRQIFVSVDITAPLYWYKEFDTYKVGTTANSCSTMHKIMSKPITLESFEIDDYDENVAIDCADQSSLTDAGRDCGFVAHWHIGEMADYIVEHCEDMRQYYIKLQEQMKAAEDEGERKRLEYDSYCVWKELIRWLPEGWLQKRTVTLTYENLHAICSKSQRYFHKLNEWSGRRNSELENFIEWVRKEIPYAEDFILYHEKEDKIKQQDEDYEYAKTFLLGCMEATLYTGRVFYDTNTTKTPVYNVLSIPKKINPSLWTVAAVEIATTKLNINKDKEKIFVDLQGDAIVITYKKNEEA